MKEAVDTKAIEEKALNHFKSFIEDNKVISQFFADNEKEPFVLLSNVIRDKEYLLGMVNYGATVV
mgnify:CR=1 FL=1